MFRIGEQAEATAESLAKVLPKFGFQRLASKDGSPALLGWLNYWSPRAANALGFPDPVKDAPILPLCRQFDDGAWLVKLTADPLDLQRPDHVAALAWAYQRFDKIGRRRTPEQEAAKKAAKQLKKAKEQAELDRAKALDPAFVVYAPPKTRCASSLPVAPRAACPNPAKPWLNSALPGTRWPVPWAIPWRLSLSLSRWSQPKSPNQPRQPPCPNPTTPRSPHPHCLLGTPT
jgi:hypothetical protein